MSAEDGGERGQGRSGFHFDANDARQKAEQARAKAELIFSRAWGLLRDPKGEWEQIRREDTTIPNILIGYVAPLAAIPPVAGLIGNCIFGMQIAGETIRAPLAAALTSTVVTWIVSIALVAFLGVLVNAVADNFDGERDDLAAQKVAAYSLTPAFLSGLFSLWPPLWWLSLFALAAMVFLIYRGLPILMKAPPERATAYTATVTIAAVVAGIVLFSLGSCVT
jgi:hypothetical protein